MQMFVWKYFYQTFLKLLIKYKELQQYTVYTGIPVYSF